MLETLLGAPRGDEPQAKFAVGLRQLTGERVGGFVQNKDPFRFLLMHFAPYVFFFLSFFLNERSNNFQRSATLCRILLWLSHVHWGN